MIAPAARGRDGDRVRRIGDRRALVPRVPGALLGIEFVIYGISLIGVSFGLRKLHKSMGMIGEKPTEAEKAA